MREFFIGLLEKIKELPVISMFIRYEPQAVFDAEIADANCTDAHTKAENPDLSVSADENF